MLKQRQLFCRETLLPRHSQPEGRQDRTPCYSVGNEEQCVGPASTFFFWGTSAYLSDVHCAYNDMWLGNIIVNAQRIYFFVHKHSCSFGRHGSDLNPYRVTRRYHCLHRRSEEAPHRWDADLYCLSLCLISGSKILFYWKQKNVVQKIWCSSESSFY